MRPFAETEILMKDIKQIFPIIFVIFLAVGLFFVVRANDSETERLAESSRLAAESSINIEDTTLVTTNNKNSESEGTDVKFSNKVFNITPENDEIDYPATAVITAKRVVEYFFDNLKKDFSVSDEINNYYNEINNKNTFSKNTIFIAIAQFNNSNSKIKISSVKYSGSTINIDITEKKAKKPDKKKCEKMFAVNVADKECNAKAIQKINVNVIKK